MNPTLTQVCSYDTALSLLLECPSSEFDRKTWRILEYFDLINLNLAVPNSNVKAFF